MGTSNSLQYLIWLSSKTVKIYSIVQSVKLLLALSIYALEGAQWLSGIVLDSRPRASRLEPQLLTVLCP